MQQEDDARARPLSGDRAAVLFEISCAGDSFYPALSRLGQFAQKRGHIFNTLIKESCKMTRGDNKRALSLRVLIFKMLEVFCRIISDTTTALAVMVVLGGGRFYISHVFTRACHTAITLSF